MAESVQPIPAGYPTLTPYLMVRGAAQAIAMTHIEDVSPEEMQRRAAAAAGAPPA